MVSGSVAAIYYGEPRLTNDVDVVLVLEQTDVARFVAAFPIDEFYCPPAEIVRIEQSREERGHLNLIHHDTGFKADLYLVRRDRLHQWGMENARTVSLDADTIQLAPPEYVIIRKLQFYREGSAEKHLRDIRRILVGLGSDWGRDTLADLVEHYGLESEWREVVSVRD